MKKIFRKHKNHKSCDRGYTLLEVVIGMFVFTFGILTVWLAQTTAVRSNVLACDVQQNTNTAVSEIEGYLAADYTDPRLDPAEMTGIPGAIWFEDEYDKGDHKILYRVVNDAALPGAKKVTITTQFQLKNGQTQFIDLKIFKPFVR